MDNDKMPAGLGCNEGLGVLPKRAGHYLPHCYQCQAAILDNDDASVCTKCGGMSLRAYPAHCCPQCGERLGYLGRAFEWFFGRTHNCNAAVVRARFMRTSAGRDGKDLVRHGDA